MVTEESVAGKVDPIVARRLPYSFANGKGIIAAYENDETVSVLLREGEKNAHTLAEARRALGKPVSAKVVSRQRFDDALKEAYSGGDESYQMVVDNIESDENLQRYVQELPKISDLLDSGDEAPIIRLVNNLFSQALREKASDIHFELSEALSVVRFRVDGTLHDVLELNPGWHAAIVSRLKVMAHLDIDVKRLPQDSRISLKLAGHPIDVRVSTLPTAQGERVVLRLLDKETGLISIDSLGLNEGHMDKLDRLIKQPHGIILVTGPTGSGKTTTLYAALNRLDSRQNNIMTVEDPIEYRLAGISQTQVDARIEMTFARALRSILRQDPDVVMIGEIRDLETARIAVQASMTGHLVLATLHTNDSVGTITRLVDMGVEPFLLSSSLLAVMAQRLVRRVCRHCVEQEMNVTEEELIEAGVEKDDAMEFKTYDGKGCAHCSGTGYEGRIGVFEMMEATQTVKDAITAQVDESQLRKIAIKEGMHSLRMDALEKVNEGSVSFKEALKKTTLVKEALPAYLLNPDELTFENGDLIIEEGNTDKNFYQLLHGSVLISRKGVAVGKISQPGEYFGEVAALMDRPRNATITSKGKSVVKVFPGDKLRQTLENYPEIALRIIKSFIIRMDVMDRNLAEFGYRIMDSDD